MTKSSTQAAQECQRLRMHLNQRQKCIEAYQAENERLKNDLTQEKHWRKEYFLQTVNLTIENERIKKEMPERVSETDFVFKICPALGNLPVTEAMPQTWRTIAQFIQKNYPHGIIITDEGG